MSQFIITVEDVYNSILSDFLQKWNSLISEKYADFVLNAVENADVPITLKVDYEDLLEYFDIDKVRKNGDPFIEAYHSTIFALSREFSRLYSVYIPLEIVNFEHYEATYTPSEISRYAKVGHIIAIRGVVRRMSEKQATQRVIYYTCPRGHTYQRLRFDIFEKPQKRIECTECSAQDVRAKAEINKKLTQYVPSLFIEIQDPSDVIDARQLPQKLLVYLEGDLSEKRLTIGDKVIVYGILYAHEAKAASVTYYVYALGLKLESEEEDDEITPEDLEKIRYLASNTNIVTKIVNSIAPSIKGLEDVKLAIALQLFGGVKRILPDGTKRRGDIHVFLVGDPGLAKSELLQYVKLIAPKAVYASAEGLTKVGLTAAVVRDEITGRWTAEPGLLAFADGGIACIDELDKMSKDDRNALHTAMEQQEITVAKAGVIVTFRAECGVLAAANPKFGRFIIDETMSIYDQIDLPPSLLSRFDIIFVIRDTYGQKEDLAIAEHILNGREQAVPEIEPKLMKKYIKYARTITPKLSGEVQEFLKQKYVEIRDLARDKSIFSITPRQLEALIRLSEAAARMRLSEIVTIDDAKLALRVFLKALESLGAISSEGIPDLSKIYGYTQKEISKIVEFKRSLIEWLKSGPKSYSAIRSFVKDHAAAYDVNEDELTAIFRSMLERGEITEIAPGRYALAY